MTSSHSLDVRGVRIKGASAAQTVICFPRLQPPLPLFNTDYGRLHIRPELPIKVLETSSEPCKIINMFSYSYMGPPTCFPRYLPVPSPYPVYGIASKIALGAHERGCRDGYAEAVDDMRGVGGSFTCIT